MILIGISGKKGVGKDLLASYFNKNYGFVNIPFAFELKEAVRRDFDFTTEHTDGKLKESPTQFISEKVHFLDIDEIKTVYWTPREIMIAYGQFFRQFDPLWWVKKAFNKIDRVCSLYNDSNELRFTISDVRFKNEADYIKSKGGLLIRLERKPELNIYKEQSLDISETDLDNYEHFDFKLDADNNITPLDLSRFANGIMDNILQKTNG